MKTPSVTPAGGVFLLLSLGGIPAGAQDEPITVEQVISREDPHFSVDATLTVGRDGRVYFASTSGDHGYALRMDREGGEKRGGAIAYAAANATANAEGVIASANGHFAHKLSFYSPNFVELAGVSDFLVSDQVGWDAPAHVEAGASGDFYGVDQHRERILRVTPAGKIVKAYPVPHEPEGHGGLVEDFRVCEKTETFYVLNRSGQIRGVGFDGKKRWAASLGVGHRSGGFDVDDSGTLYAIGRHSDTLNRLTPDGQPAGEIRLLMKDRKPAPSEHGFTELRIHAGDLFLKRRHRTELFERYDLASGALKTVVEMAHERLTVRFPRAAWTAGESLPFTISFSAAGRAPSPRWRVWARPLNSLDYRELALREGMLQVPADAAGVYQVKVTPEVLPWQRGRESEYIVRTVVEVLQPGTRGLACVLTPDNRTSYGRGEEIPFIVTGRELPTEPEVRLMEGLRVLFQTKLTAREEERRLPKELTTRLRPGAYEITVAAPGLTVVPKRIVIGPGIVETRFHTIQYGDYGALYPTAGAWDAPDVAAAHVERTARLGMNLMVDRIGSHLHAGDLAWNGRGGSELEALAKRFPDIGGAARPLPPLLETLSGYGAQGIQQMAILMSNDAGLPLGGPGFDHRKPDEILRTLTQVTNTLKPFPAFRGWSWSSNWWIFDKRGAAAARTKEEKAACEAALKRARETGAWDPVLDEVAGVRLGFAVEAQDLFNRTLRSIAPDLVTASACPYRNVESYPPISLSNVDESDLQAQWEQIAVPYHAPHAVDFYRRPGKPAWVHPEAWNDAGTGDQILPTLLAALMRGADGVGVSGPIAPWMSGPDGLPHDPRSSHYGTASVFRALNGVMKSYGPWWTSLEPSDPVAIVASGRMLKIDEWLGMGVTGRHFSRLLEAYCACLHAHYPATYAFAEDLKADSLARFKAVLVVGQQVEMEPALVAALKAAKAAGVAVFHDGTCRPELVKDFTPLGTSFDRFEKDPHPASDDAAYWRFPEYCRAHLAPLTKALRSVTPPPAEVEDEEVFLSERRCEEGRYLFLVNNTTPRLEPGQLWRVTLCVASRVPVQAPVRLGAGHIYDAFALRKVEGEVRADFRSLPARIYAILPAAIARVDLRGPEAIKAGQSFAWTVRVLDEGGKAIRAGIPVRVRLLSADGAVLDERSVAAASRGAGGTFTAAFNGGAMTLEASELLSGRTARLELAPERPAEPVGLAEARSPSPPVPAKAIGKPVPASLFPAEHAFGPHFRDVALIADGSLAVMNAMNWDHNLYAVEVESGRLKWRRRAGNYFAFAPQALRSGFAVQGFSLESAEGYHLYLADSEGKFERRFALAGLPKRLPHRFVPAILDDRINNFALSEDGSWVAGGGDLGLAVWSRDGRLLWSQDESRTRSTATLAALDPATLLVVRGMKAAARDAATGRTVWELDLAPTGDVKEVRASRDGKTCALLATSMGGRVFVLRGGKLVAAFPTSGGNAIDFSPDGSLVALVTGNLLKLYSVEKGLQWILPGDDFMRFPRISPDGGRVAAASDLGTLYVADAGGQVLLERDLGACAAPCWLPQGDLLLATWMGTVSRLDRGFRERWRTLVRPEAADMRDRILAEEKVPATRVTSWINAAAQPVPLAPNLLSEKSVLIKLVAGQSHIQFARPVGSLVDGKAEPPAEPWIKWGDVGSFAETSPFNYVLIDTFRTRLRVTAITFVEDPAHPESWLRDARLEFWDAAKEEWVFIQQLLSDSAVHTHRLALPIEAARFRIVLPRGHCGNLRLAEIVLHGEELGNSHPDVIARRPVAVLFDEGDDLKGSLVQGPLSFRFESAYAGGRCLALASNAKAAPLYQPPFGHVIPNWDFEIVEKPQPGQYRHLQLAWRALSPETKGMTFSLGGANFGEKIQLHAGAPTPEEGGRLRKVTDAPPREWELVRVDLWETYGKPVRVRSMSAACVGGGAAFDRILLAREEKDLSPRR